MTKTLPLRELGARLRCLEGEIAKEKGEFTLFALVQTDIIPWDQFELLVSAPWLVIEGWQTQKFFHNLIRERLGPEVSISIAGVTPLHPSDARVKGITQSLPEVEHGLLEWSTWTLFTDVDEDAVRYAVVITSRRDQQAVLLRD
jgi:hypothetical protein